MKALALCYGFHTAIDSSRKEDPGDHLSLKLLSMALTCPPPTLTSPCLSLDIVLPPWIDDMGLLFFWFLHVSGISREAEEWGSSSSTQPSVMTDLSSFSTSSASPYLCYYNLSAWSLKNPLALKILNGYRKVICSTWLRETTGQIMPPGEHEE